MTSSIYRRWIVCGLALFAAGSACAQISKQGNGYLFRMKFTKGQTITYVMKMNSQVGAQPANVAMQLTQKTVAVASGGKTATVNVTVGQPLLNGKPLPQNSKGPKTSTKPTSMTLTVDSMGHVQGGQQQTSIDLPSNPVAVGGTWKSSSSINQVGVSMEVFQTYKFIGMERVGGVNAAKVAVTMKGTGQIALTGSGTAWLSMADGWLIKNDSTMIITMGQMVIPSKVTIVRK